MASKSNGHLNKLKKAYRIDKRKLISAAEALSQAAHDAKTKITHVEHNVEKYAKTNPWKTMGISILAGVLVGQLWNLRK